MNIPSIAVPVGRVDFPSFSGLQVYMLGLQKRFIDTMVPPQYRETIRRMVETVKLKEDDVFYLTIDERTLKAGDTHRRGGAHMDGNYLNDWGGGGWLNGVPGRVLTPKLQKAQYGDSRGMTILASNFPACVGWQGALFNANAGQGGDCEHLRERFSELEQFKLEGNVGYACTSTFIHQSVPVTEDVDRQLIRITVNPGGRPKLSREEVLAYN